MKYRSVLLALAVASCVFDLDGVDPRPPGRNEVLESIALDVIVPTYRELEAKAAAQATAVEALCGSSGPTQDSLDEAQRAWRAVRVPLRQSDAFAFGPVEDERIGSAIDFWPAREDAITTALAAAETPTPEYVDALGVATKGLPVIEYLLFDPEGGDAAVLQALDPDTSDGAYRCAFVTALAADVAQQTTALGQAWDLDGGNFATELAQAGSGSERYDSVQMAVDELLNANLAALTQATDMRLGKPLGTRNGGTPQPDSVESRFSDNAIADLQASLQGVKTVYMGSEDGLGWTDLVAADAPSLDESIREQFARAEEALAALDEPLRTAVTGDGGPAEKARAELLELRRLFTVDVIGLFGGTVTFNDADGD